MGKPEIEAFLSHLVMKRNVASSTQNQAFNAILFLYNHVLDEPMPENINALRSKKPVRVFKEDITFMLAAFAKRFERPQNYANS
ncbi:MAG: hypothetical protein HKO68_10030 [Desulfobacterales bacterium]|nr:hypothetical protein [Desulfobacterales bacterium]